MPKQIPSEELDALLRVVTLFLEGAGLEEITKQLPATTPRRTLQRRLASLVAQKRLVLEGAGRGSRYRKAIPADEIPQGKAPRGASTRSFGDGASAMFLREDPPADLPVAADAESVRRKVRAPIHARKPVGYKREFLDSYRPNYTAYLSPELRRKLAAAGRAPEGEMPAGTRARQLFHRLLIDLSWNSSRLEGNTYSLLETERLLELGESATGKEAREAQMILNHKAAIELMVEQADEIGFNPYTLLNLHTLLSENLMADRTASGRLRTIPVGIGGTVYHPLAVPALVEECFATILLKAGKIADPFEQAFFAMVHLPYLQPFEDVNKRVSRLAANIPLIQRNLCPLSFVGVPQRDYIDGILGVYEMNRVELLREVFVQAYEQSCARYSAVQRSLGEPDPFRLRHRVLIAETVATILRGAMGRDAAIELIRREATAKMPDEDRARFVEEVETDLLSLHDGNFARFRVRPSEYYAWRSAWR